MPAIFVRDPHCSSREKLDIPGDLDSETIESLKRLISGKVGLESENFSKWEWFRKINTGKVHPLDNKSLY